MRQWPALLAALLLAASFVFAVSCGKPPAPAGVTVDPQLARLVPPGTYILAGVDVARLRAAPFYQQHPQFDAWAQRAGLNPHRDLSKLLVAWSGNRRFFLTERQPPSRTKIPTYGADPAAHGRGGLSQELKRQLGELSKQDQIWIVSANGLPLVLMPEHSDIRSALSNIAGSVKAASAGLSVAAGIRLRADLACVSDAGAQRVRDALRGGIALLRFTSRDPELQHLYAAIDVEQNRGHVTMQANLSPQESAALVRYLAPRASNGRLR